MGERIWAVNDIMGHDEALYIPPSGAFLVSVECVVELGEGPDRVYSLTL